MDKREARNSVNKKDKKKTTERQQRHHHHYHHQVLLLPGGLMLYNQNPRGTQKTMHPPISSQAIFCFDLCLMSPRNVTKQNKKVRWLSPACPPTPPPGCWPNA